MHQKLSRDEYQKKIGKKILGENNCPFCEPDETINKIIWKGCFWNIMVNISPYTGDDYHIMATPVKHKKFFYELEDGELLELKKVHEFVKDYYPNGQYFSATRETFGNRSVEHYHTHFFPGKLSDSKMIQMLDEQGLVTK